MPIRLVKKLWNSSLHRNAIFLMISNVTTAGFGFVFWIVCAKFYSPKDVGYATAMISAMGLIASFSMLGFNYGLVRFLPESNKKNEMISTCYVICGIIAIFLAAMFLIGLNLWSPSLLYMRGSLVAIFLFIVIVFVWSLYSLTDTLFLAGRKTIFSFEKSLIYSVVKVLLPIFLIPLSMYGIFLSLGIGAAIGLGVGILVFVPLVINNIRWKLVIDRKAVNDMMHFSYGNYVAAIMSGLPALLFPLMIVNMYGPEHTAYFYIAWTIAGIIFMIPSSVASSLFAEGSNEPKKLRQNVKNALEFSFILVIPVIAIAIFLDEKILLIFGQAYSDAGANLLRILALSGFLTIPIAINTSRINVQKRIKMLLLLSFVIMVVTITASYILLNKMGIIGIGYGWIIGQVAVLGVIAMDLIFSKSKKD